MGYFFSVRRRIVSKLTGATKSTETRWGSDLGSLTCTQNEAAFLGISKEQKLAQTILTAPVPAEGTHLELRDCTGTTLSDIFVTCSRDDFTPYDTTPPPASNYNTKGVLGGHYTV